MRSLKKKNFSGNRALYNFAGVEGVRDVAARVEQPAVRVVRVPLAGYIAHVLQSVDLLLHEHPVPGRFRVGVSKHARIRVRADPSRRRRAARNRKAARTVRGFRLTVLDASESAKDYVRCKRYYHNRPIIRLYMDITIIDLYKSIRI